MSVGGSASGPVGSAVDPLVAQVRDLMAGLAGLAGRGGGGAVLDAVRVERLRALEELKNAACAAQARLGVDLDASQRAAQAAAGVPAKLQGRGVAAQVGLARRESPHRGARHLGLGKVLVTEMPHTYAAMAAGWLSEWRATLLAKETGCLSREHRAAVDEALVGDRGSQLEGWSDQRLEAEVRKLAYRLDPQAVLARIRRAENDRCVTSRPAPDTMAYLSALLPAAQAVACYAALSKAADTARAAGDPRTRGQVMADTLVELLTGQKTAEATAVEIQLVVTDQTLFANLANFADLGRQDTNPGTHPGTQDARPGAGGQADDHSVGGLAGGPRDEPGYLHGYGTVPAGWVRGLVAGLPADTQAWVRRLYAHPDTGQLVAMDSRRRLFTHSRRRFTVVRDRTCRTPWCGAPIRHADHPTPHAHGGATSRANSQGLCEACNYAKQAPGWTAHAAPGPVHTIRTLTPTGHAYDSTAPPLPGWHPPPPAGQPTTHDAPPVDPLSPEQAAAWFDHYLTKHDPPDQAAA